MSDTGMPDTFDRLIGGLQGLPDVVFTKPTTVRSVTPLIGDAQTFIIQTYRQKDVGDTIFLECVHGAGSFRLALPPRVAEAIARQRDALTTKARSKAARASAQERMNRGDKPFTRRQPKGGRS